jgi:flagellar motor protein MotB
MAMARRGNPIGRCAAAPRAAWALVAVAVAACTPGCSNHPFHRSATPAAVSLVPPPGVAAPAATLPPPPTPLPSFVDGGDPRQLQATLARNQQERQLLQDEITALREQLASTSTQLAASRGLPAGMPGPAALAGPAFPGAVAPDGGGPLPFAAGMPPAAPRPASLDAGLAELALPGLEKRVDGGVVRLEIPADRLFDEGSAALVPGGAALLAQVAGEIDRVYPQHFIGIEGHLDTEPVDTAVWASPHQLTAARATTVFDFFTTRTPLKRGQLFLVAHGGNHPVVSNATAAGRGRNRRVELVVYPERVAATHAGAAAP